MPNNYSVNHIGPQDLDTGQQYDGNGNPVDTEAGVDPALMAEMQKSMQPRKPTLVGNIADLQVQGAQQAQSGAEGLEMPPGMRNPPPALTDPQTKQLPAEAEVVGHDVQFTGPPVQTKPPVADQTAEQAAASTAQTQGQTTDQTSPAGQSG